MTNGLIDIDRSSYLLNSNSPYFIKHKLNYNNDYCSFAGIVPNNYGPYSHRHSSATNHVLNEISKVFGPNDDRLTTLLTAPAREIVSHFDGQVDLSYIKNDSFCEDLIRDHINKFLEPQSDLACNYVYGNNVDVILNFNRIAPYRIGTRTGTFVTGGGIIGKVMSGNTLKPLVALMVKRELVQLPRLSWLTNTPITNEDNTFVLYVQGGFDYKETEEKSLRSFYRKHIIPWAKEHKIEIVTRPNLLADLFLIPTIPTFASAREENQYYKDQYRLMLEANKPTETPAETNIEMPW